MGSVSRRWRLSLALVFYALLAVFLARYLRGIDWAYLGRLQFDPVWLLLALPMSLLPRLLQPIAWRTLIRGYGEPAPPYVPLARVYATSWLGRYIPGKIAWIGAKIFLGRQHGVSAATLAATSVAEAALHLSTALALALALLGLPQAGLFARVGERAWLLAVIALAALSVLLLPPVFNRMVALARSLGRAPVPAAAGRLAAPALLASGTTYLIIHALSGIPVYFILRSMYAGVGPAMIPALTAATLLAGTLGTLAVFAPAGIGVREGILILLFSAIVPAPVAVAAAVVLRLWSIVMDLLFYGSAVALDRGGHRAA